MVGSATTRKCPVSPRGKARLQPTESRARPRATGNPLIHVEPRTLSQLPNGDRGTRTELSVSRDASWVVRTANFRCPKISKIWKIFGNFRIVSAALQIQMWNAVHLPNSFQDTWKGCLEAPARPLDASWVVRTANFRCPKISKFWKIFGNFQIVSAALQIQMWDAVHLPNSLQDT